MGRDTMSGSGFTKLYSSIVLSTVWREPHHVRIVWVTMLALADANGYVGASVPGLADAARVSIDECEDALRRFQATDPYSRTKDHDGRRVEEADGGWILLNHKLYRDGRDPEKRRQQNREAQARYRDRKRKPKVSQDKPPSAQEEEEEEAEEEEHLIGAHDVPPRPKQASGSARGGQRRWRRVPTDWQPNDSHRALATELGVPFDAELAKFRDHEYPKAKTDADACFRNWLRSAAEFREQRGPRRGATTPTQPNYGARFNAEEVT